MKLYIVMWTYFDGINTLSGNVEILANNRNEAEKIFYELNQPLIIGKENGQPIFNPAGGYICECVLTYKEWENEGSPTQI